MKIAFLTPEFPHSRISDSGGIGTSISNLSKGLLQLDHQVIVLVYGQDEDAVFEENGLVFYKIKNIKFKGISRFLSQKKIEKLLNKLVSENKIDIVEAPDWGMTSFIKTACPLVVRFHGSDTYFCHLDNRPVKWNNYFHEKRVIKNADAIISVSEFTGNLTNKLFKIDKDFTVIPNGIDVENFKFSSNVSSDNKVILYFGTLIRKKGLLELPFIFNEVIKKNPDAKLILIGRDNNDIISGNASTWQMMQKLFSPDALKNVDYKGSVPYSEIKSHIQKATVCVFPTFAEALPVSWIEAMAMQKPIVASNIGWAKEVIDDEVNGFLVHPKNHSEYADKICKLLNDKELQSRFGVEARIKAISNFDSKIIAEKSVAFYKKMIQE